MKIKSNITNLGEYISIEGLDGNPRKIISLLLKNIEHDIVILSFIYVGRRIIRTENLALLSGRRHRKYFGLKIRNKIYIKFGWHKIKNLTENEFMNLKNNWNLNFFENKGAYLIKKSGGVLYPDHLIYTKGKIQI